MSDDIYHQVEEDLKHQELMAFWKENRAWIIGGIAASIVFTGALAGWRDYDHKRNLAQTAQLAAVALIEDPVKIAKQTEGMDKKHAVLAKFAEAKALSEKNESAKAVAVYDDIAAMKGVDKIWRDLATLYGVNAEIDTGDPAKLHAQLAVLIKDKSAWRFSAEELQGLLYAREGKLDKAKETLSSLADNAEAPQDVRTRAATLRDLYTADADKG